MAEHRSTDSQISHAGGLSGRIRDKSEQQLISGSYHPQGFADQVLPILLLFPFRRAMLVFSVFTPYFSALVIPRMAHGINCGPDPASRGQEVFQFGLVEIVRFGHGYLQFTSAGACLWPQLQIIMK